VALSQVVAGLEWAHAHGAVHQDLHVKNIMQTSDGSRWKIIDFSNAAWTNAPPNLHIR